MHAPQPSDHLTAGIVGRLDDEHGRSPRLHNEEVTIAALRLLWSSRGKFVLAVVLATAFATLFLRFGPRTYTAESVVRFDFAGSPGATGTPRLALDAATMIDAEARIVRSRIVAEHVVSRLRLADDAAFASPPGPLTQVINVLDRYSSDLVPQHDEQGVSREGFNLAVERVMAASTVDHDSKSYLIEIRFRWSDPQTAARLANALAQEYMRERQVQSLTAAKARLSADLTQIGLRLGEKFPTYLALKAQLDEIGHSIEDVNRPAVTIRSVALGDFTADIAIPAQASPVHVSPSARSVYILALMAGILFAAAFLLLRQSYDTRLNDEWAVADRLGVRCLGMIPDGTSWRASGRAALQEAARSLVVSSGLDIKEQGCRVVVLTSSLPDEGKTLLATELAEVLARSGQRVLLVDAVPRAHSHWFGHRSGLSSRDQLTVAKQVTAPFQIAVMRDRLRALVSANGFDEYMIAVRKSHDVVIIKAPPVLMLSDAAHLTRHADLSMLLVHWRKTPARIAGEAIRRLHEAGTPVSGVVLTNIRLQRQVDAIVHDQSYYLARYGKFYASISS